MMTLADVASIVVGALLALWIFKCLEDWWIHE
jgi:hypothetical protein